MLRLRDAVQARAPGELRPLALDGMPVELTPVVMAINDYAQRLEHHAGAQRVFIQNAAHQLRTPLTVLTTQLTYAMRGDGAMDADVLPAIRDTVHHAAHLVHQLLALSAAEPTGHAPDDVVSVDLASVVQRVLEDLSGRAQSRGIDLGFEGTDVAPASTHPMAAREIVVNLVDNAIRYTQPGGIVTVSLQPLEGRVRLTVEDNGPGIPEALRERVFERFFRVDNADSDGSGLGLPIVREFAAGVGATVALRTPAAGSGLAVDVSFRAAADSGQA